MSDKKPEYKNIEMHMPEGDLAPIPTEPGHKVATGPIIIFLIILLILILGGMYWWYVTKLQSPAATQIIERPTAEQNNEPESTTAEAQAESLQVMSTSDELSAIEADLEGTNLDSLDAEITAVDSELNAAN